MKKTPVSIVIAFLLSSGPLMAQGMRFSGQTVMIQERTSLDLFGLSHCSFHGGLEISFDFISSPSAKYGYLLRMSDYRQDDPTLNISFDNRSDSMVVRLNEEGRRSLIKIGFGPGEYKDHIWTPVRLRFIPEADSVFFSFGNMSGGARLERKSARYSPSLHFGLSGHVVDVPSFAIRNLRVEGGRRSISFPLDEYEGTVVHDSHGRRTGTVVNPNWLMDAARRWEHAGVLSSDKPGGIVYSPLRKSVILYNEDEVRILGMEGGGMTRTPYNTPCPMHFLLGTNFLKGDTLTAYELNDWKRNNTGVSVATLDLGTMDWHAVSTDRLIGQMHHHGGFVNPESGEFTFFGGFGMNFGGSFTSLGKDGKWHVKWENHEEGRTLYPRFFCAAGLDTEGRYAYYFGGLGNESGEVVVGRRYFYDLHRLDVRTGECTRLWSLDHVGEDFVPARNLIVDGDSIYALCYPEYLSESVMHLYRFSISEGTYEMLGDGISVNSDKVWCSSSLYLDKELGKFIVTSSNVDDDLRPVADVYTLLYPPASFKEESWLARHRLLLIAAALLLLLATSIGTGHVVRKRASLKEETESYIKAQSDQRKKVFHPIRRPNSICLFGDFLITDRDGNDISRSFTRQQRTLLLLLLHYGRTGISSQRLSGILWPDKDEDKVKNSRGVAMNNLRKSLSRLDGISVVYEGGTFRIVLEEPAWCDFTAMGEADVDTMLSIVSAGRFLQGVSDPEFDSFKDQVESSVAPILGEEIAKRYESGQYRVAIEIADMIFAYDPLDENALHYAVRSLMAIQHRDDALMRYAAFAAEYQRTNSEVYPVKFEKI